ncbi:DUF924 family protein [Rhodanobacter sp. C03]|uniref:DUF924 family protein n=1 Tax=Rhodanobacter sp. C03 TaxID=1945858 RepID=UPI000984765D|nr:DUF924 family protein [Rhodanobacter sp. C03]OOG60425.1 hypothetical protein B0E48_05395 [Rhodanobacter sp. C03]
MSASTHESEAIEPAWVGDVLRFWFEELSHADWFKKNDALDARIRDHFFDLHAHLLAEEERGLAAPRTMLAAVIVLDQFSRNIFRDDARAYAADPLARRIARSAIDQGYDATMAVQEKRFLYLPFEHSEDVHDQQLSVNLTEPLGDPEMTEYAIAHQVIIDRFGRFPHRNATLGRRSTPEEIAFLKSPMSSF